MQTHACPLHRLMRMCSRPSPPQPPTLSGGQLPVAHPQMRPRRAMPPPFPLCTMYNALSASSYVPGPLTAEVAAVITTQLRLASRRRLRPRTSAPRHTAPPSRLPGLRVSILVVVNVTLFRVQDLVGVTGKGLGVRV